MNLKKSTKKKSTKKKSTKKKVVPPKVEPTIDVVQDPDVETIIEQPQGMSKQQRATLGF